MNLETLPEAIDVLCDGLAESMGTSTDTLYVFSNIRNSQIAFTVVPPERAGGDREKLVKAIQTAIGAIPCIEAQLASLQNGAHLLDLFCAVKRAVVEGSPYGTSVRNVHLAHDNAVAVRVQGSKVTTTDIHGRSVVPASICVSKKFVAFADTAVVMDESANSLAAAWFILERLFPAMAQCGEDMVCGCCDLSLALADEIKTRAVVHGLMSKILFSLPGLSNEVYRLRHFVPAATARGTYPETDVKYYSNWDDLYTHLDENSSRVSNSFSAVIETTVTYSLKRALAEAATPTLPATEAYVIALRVLNEHRNSLIAALIQDKHEIWTRPRHFRMRLAELIAERIDSGRQ